MSPTCASGCFLVVDWWEGILGGYFLPYISIWIWLVYNGGTAALPACSTATPIRMARSPTLVFILIPKIKITNRPRQSWGGARHTPGDGSGDTPEKHLSLPANNQMKHFRLSNAYFLSFQFPGAMAPRSCRKCAVMLHAREKSCHCYVRSRWCTCSNLPEPPEK